MSAEAPTPADPAQQLRAWFEERLPETWGATSMSVSFDREEILVVIEIPAQADPADRDDAIAGFRETTRPERIRIAREAESYLGRKVSWGVACGDARAVFTNLSVPVMTRLRMTERGVLDTLVSSGVARSRSEALAWCVRLVGKHEADWMKELREALVEVEKARRKGPRS